MKKVTLRSAVQYRDGIVKAGETLEVPNEVAQDWKERRLLHEGSGPTEQDRLRLQVARAERIAGLRAADADELEELLEAGEGGGRVEARLVFLPVTAAQYEALADAGYGSADAIRAASDDELLAVESIGDRAVANLRTALGTA